MFDPVEFGKAMGEMVREATAPLIKRIDELEKNHLPEVGPQGERGEAGPAGPQGETGRDGRDGQAGRDGKDGERGSDGANGNDGSDGKDGADGLGFDDLVVDYDGSRQFVFRFQRGDVIKEFPFTLPVVLDAGFWNEGKSFQAGDGVTCGGSYWIAKCETTAKPGLSDDWRLAVKKGRDGKDGKEGEKGEQGERGMPGYNGRDLR